MKARRHTDIKLTEGQQKILDQINFDIDQIVENRSAQQNGELVCSLTKELVNENLIPRIRIEYFVNPQYNSGSRNKSRKEVFEKNGSSGDDMLKHLHFLQFFEYFVFGPNLPGSVISSFKEAVENCGPITSGDVLILKKFVKECARVTGLGRESIGEFYRLAIECDIPLSYASMIVEGVPKKQRR